MRREQAGFEGVEAHPSRSSFQGTSLSRLRMECKLVCMLC